MIATHDVDYAMGWADQVFLFTRYLRVAFGTPEEVFADRETLRETNLRQPAVLELFETLCRKGILSSELKTPRRLEDLERYIRES